MQPTAPLPSAGALQPPPLAVAPKGVTRWAKPLLVALLVIAVAVGALYVLSPDFRGQIQGAVTPSCTVGLNGAAVSVTVQGPDAQFQCNSFLSRTTDGGTWYLYSGGQQPAGASICQVHYKGDLITVRDQGALNIYGNSICTDLINAANGGFVPGATTGQGYQPPTEDPAEASAKASASAEARSRSDIDAAASAVRSEIQGLADSESGLADDLASIPTDLRSMAADVATTKKDRDAVLAEASDGSTDRGTVCGDAATVAGDRATVEGDLATINGDGATINGDVYTLQNAISDLQGHRDQLAAARAKLPTYHDGGPTSADIETALAKANAAIDAAPQTFAGYLKTAQGYVSTASGYADSAQHACDTMP